MGKRLAEQQDREKKGGSKDATGGETSKTDLFATAQLSIAAIQTYGMPRMPASIAQGCMLEPLSAALSWHQMGLASTIRACMLKPAPEILSQHHHKTVSVDWDCMLKQPVSTATQSWY